MFIYDFLGSRTEVILITRFRRTGKSMVLDMLHRFLSETVHRERTGSYVFAGAGGGGAGRG